jgi:hypothetical protein
VLEKKLKIISMLQEKYSDLHIGGSIGLYLHGIDLKRDVGNSDIDLAKAVDDIEKTNSIEEHFSDGNDFTYRMDKGGIHYEIKIDPEQKYVIKYHKGIAYRVTDLDTIIFYKQDYADKGYEKHIKDMARINSYLITQK